MLVHLLYLIGICLSTWVLYLNNRNIGAGYPAKYISSILKGGLLYILCSYLFFVFYPKQLYRVLAFPIGLLYSTVLFIEHYRFLGHSLRRFYQPIIPFVVGLVGYTILMLIPAKRYLFLHEYFILIHVSVCIMLLVYVVWVVFIPAKGCKSRPRLRSRKYVSLVLCTLATFMLMFMLLWVERGKMESYIISALSCFVLVLVYMVQFFAFHRRGDDTVTAVDSDVEIDVPVRDELVVSKDLILAYKIEIQRFIGSRAYLAVDLTKDIFSERVNIPKAHISPFLREAYGKGFNAFINELRVTYASKELKRKDLAYTMEELSFICGFRSRASFYRNFIAVFGCSPLQYRNEQLGLSNPD